MWISSPSGLLPCWAIQCAQQDGCGSVKPDDRQYRGLSKLLARGREGRSAAFQRGLGVVQKAIELDPSFAMAHARVGYTYAVTWAESGPAKPYLDTAFRLSHRLTLGTGYT